MVQAQESSVEEGRPAAAPGEGQGADGPLPAEWGRLDLERCEGMGRPSPTPASREDLLAGWGRWQPVDSPPFSTAPQLPAGSAAPRSAELRPRALGDFQTFQRNLFALGFWFKAEQVGGGGGWERLEERAAAGGRCPPWPGPGEEDGRPLLSLALGGEGAGVTRRQCPGAPRPLPWDRSQSPPGALEPRALPPF